MLVGQVELKRVTPGGMQRMILNVGDTFFEEAVTLASYIEDHKKPKKEGFSPQ